MTKQSKETLKSYFEDGDVPVEAQYIDLIDSLGDGDMTKAEYDTNDDGVVEAALDSDKLDGLHESSFHRTDEVILSNGYDIRTDEGVLAGSLSDYVGTGKVAYLNNLISRKSSTQYPVYALHPLTNDGIASATYAGGNFSTFAKTAKTVSTEFSGVPTSAKLLLLNVSVRDSGSAANECWVIVSPNNTAGNGFPSRCSGLANDFWFSQGIVVPTDGANVIYFQGQASGSNTLEISIRCHGYSL